jgi:hypothetical protein
MVFHLFKLWWVFLLSLIAPQFASANYTEADLANRREEIKNWALTCNYGGEEGLFSFGTNPDQCKMGDSTIFTGISCLAARLAGDDITAQKRCRDVFVAQGSNGRWWRGLIHVDDPEEQNTLSRDQGLGVLAALIAEKMVNPASAKQKAQAWINWIINEGKGGMCINSDGKVPQLCRANGSFGSVMYRVFDYIGAIDESNQKSKFIRKLKRLNFLYKKVAVPETGISRLSIRIARRGFTGDFEFHLKSIQLILERLIKGKSTRYLDSLAKTIYKWDPKNPVYQLLYEGRKTRNYDAILNTYCPAQRPVISNTDPVFFSGNASFFIQNNMRSRKYLIPTGHECIYAINLILADQNGSLPTSGRAKKNRCKLGARKIGVYSDGLPICRGAISARISKSKCEYYNGEQWQKPNSNKRFCLIFRDGRYKARRLSNKTCPRGGKHEGELLNTPICTAKRINGFSLAQCYENEEYSFSNNTVQHESTHCLVPENGYWKKYKITRKCPKAHKFLGISPWGYPMCRPLNPKRLKVEEDHYTQASDLEGNLIENVKVPKTCDKPIWISGIGGVPLVHKNFCGVQTNGHFKAYRFDTCPKTMKWLFEHNGKSVCKARAPKIKTRKCQRKGRPIVSGQCLKDRGKFYSARKIK